MMKVVHFSKDEDFEPDPIESLPGFGKGCFFYEMPEYREEVEDLAVKWGRRTAHFFEIDDECVEFVQDEGIAEYFVNAENLDKLRRVEPELKEVNYPPHECGSL